MISTAYLSILPKLVSLNFFLNCERENWEKQTLPDSDSEIHLQKCNYERFIQIQDFYYKTNDVTFVFIFYQLFGIQSQLTFCETAASIFTCFFFMSINPVLIILGKSWHHKKCRQQQRRRWGEGDTWCSQDTVRPLFSCSFI